MPDDIADYLAAQGIGTVASDIFISGMPDSPDNCVSVIQSAGRPPHSVGDMEHPNCQIKVRNTDHDTGEAKMASIYNQLHRKTHTTINTRMYYYIGAQGSFAYEGKDEANRHMWVCNFIIDKLVE